MGNFAINYTTTPCGIKLVESALDKYSKGGVKIHMVLGLRGSILGSIYITDSWWHESNFLDVYEPYKWSINIMDKAYLDNEVLYKVHLNGTNFVIMEKATIKCDVVDINYNYNDLVGIMFY